jgi:hypothetical protein
MCILIHFPLSNAHTSYPDENGIPNHAAFKPIGNIIGLVKVADS